MLVTHRGTGKGPVWAGRRPRVQECRTTAQLGLAGCLVALLIGLLAPAGASAAGTKVVSYRGYRMVVPAGWPVYHVSADSTVCVRFNRHAVYLGEPGTSQSCAMHAAGRTEAILVQPLRDTAATRAAVAAPGEDRPLPIPTLGAAEGPSGSIARVVDRALGVVVTATWHRHSALIRRALGVSSLSALAAASRVRPVPARATAGRAHQAGVGPGAALPGAVFDGGGFDACSTPSASQMSAWALSPFQAVGIYIGGVNMACSQPNLSAAWVSRESSTGWHLVPIYVGLQAPSNSCGCASISSADATAQGTAAAVDAVAQVQALGIGAGNPIYFDMEGYTRSTMNTASVLAFLAAWTNGLHTAGYKSGVYSSDDSGIEDLASQFGTAYTEPDDIWFANWNGKATVSDSALPAADWASGQRLHQYEGGHNATYGGDTINIDDDELDGQTAAAGSAATVASAPPVASGPPTITGTPLAGQTMTDQHALWNGSPASYSYLWEVCDATGANCALIPGATAQTYVLTAGDVGDTLRVLEGAANAVGAAVAVSSGATAVVRRTASGYWLFTGYGNVYNSLYEAVLRLTRDQPRPPEHGRRNGRHAQGARLPACDEVRHRVQLRQRCTAAGDSPGASDRGHRRRPRGQLLAVHARGERLQQQGRNVLRVSVAPTSPQSNHGDVGDPDRPRLLAGEQRWGRVRVRQCRVAPSDPSSRADRGDRHGPARWLLALHGHGQRLPIARRCMVRLTCRQRPAHVLRDRHARHPVMARATG